MTERSSCAMAAMMVNIARPIGVKVSSASWWEMKSIPKERNSSNAKTNCFTLRANRSNLHPTEKINPILRGWVSYCRVGHSSLCFGVVKRWVEKKVRQHLMRARGCKGYGWQRWSSEWLYDRLGLFNDYRLRRWSVVKAAPAR